MTRRWSPKAIVRGLALVVVGCTQPRSRPAPPPEEPVIVVPRLWNSDDLKDWATPLAGGSLPDYFSPKEYYAAPVDNLRTYPVYHPDREPPGYWRSLQQKMPEPLIEIGVKRNETEWVASGERVFEELDIVEYRTDDSKAIAWIRDPEAVKKNPPVGTKDGVFPFFRWVVTAPGQVKLGTANCAMCHQRVLDDGTLLRGAPSNLNGGEFAMAACLAAGDKWLETRGMKLRPGESSYASWGVPWLADDIHARFKTMSDEEVSKFGFGDFRLGTFPRDNGSPFYTNKFADLIGVKYRRYLDATATHANRGPEDIARYGILVQFADTGSFSGHAVRAKKQAHVTVRPPDEAMYAVAMYLYTLEYPSSPHPFDDRARRGGEIFEAEGCTECHTPPLYTNNKLVRAPGFDPPEDDPATQRLNISLRRVGTDAGLATKTRKGTGYYKIPMLRGLWYRGLYEHSGSIAKLEDWFDPKRLREDYVPTGWKGPGVKTRAVPGHKFGHDLSAEDKRALIAFLKTL